MLKSFHCVVVLSGLWFREKLDLLKYVRMTLRGKEATVVILWQQLMNPDFFSVCFLFNKGQDSVGMNSGVINDLTAFVQRQERTSSS